jgi:Family of unknown function (DUF5318)
LWGSYTFAVSREIDYALARRLTVRDFRSGALTRLDVCDAHPELLRAARNLGEHSEEDCPVCSTPDLRRVRYVYGDTLKAANGRCVDGTKELARLQGSVDEFACYVVEVCVDCGWNYLIRSTILGRGQAG